MRQELENSMPSATHTWHVGDQVVPLHTTVHHRSAKYPPSLANSTYTFEPQSHPDNSVRTTPAHNHQHAHHHAYTQRRSTVRYPQCCTYDPHRCFNKYATQTLALAASLYPLSYGPTVRRKLSACKATDHLLRTPCNRTCTSA